MKKRDRQLSDFLATVECGKSPTLISTNPRFLTRGLLQIIVCLLLAHGCAAPKRAFQPQVAVDKLSDIEFTHYLATVPVATVDEGMRATLLLTGDSMRWPAFHDRHEELIRRGAVRRSWNAEADETLYKGTLAHMLRVMCAMPKSVNEWLWVKVGLGDRRYALETCIYERVMPPSRAGEAVTGGELLTAVNEAQEYLEKREPASP